MGEVSDMMLDGTLCAGCGVFLNEQPQGFPCYCSKQCEPEYMIKGKKDKVKCPNCNKWVKESGLKQHVYDKHVKKPEFENAPINPVLDEKIAREFLQNNVKR